MQRREPQVRKVELKKSQFFNGLAKLSSSALLSSAKNSKTCVAVYMRMTCYKGKAQLLPSEQTPSTQSLGLLNCEIICSSSVKNTIGSLLGIALNL